MSHTVVPEVDPETSEASCTECGEHVDLTLVDGEETWLHGSEIVEIEEEKDRDKVL